MLRIEQAKLVLFCGRDKTRQKRNHVTWDDEYSISFVSLCAIEAAHLILRKRRPVESTVEQSATI
jgi:hypothetical protein